MLRFTYTEMSKMFKHIITEEEKQKKNIFNPKVSAFPDEDVKQLVKQIWMSKNQARVVIGMHGRNSFIYPSDHPSIEECEVFVGAMEVFGQYIDDNYDTLKVNIKLLDKMIKTVIVVRDKRIISNSFDSFLNERLKKYARQTSYTFTDEEDVFLEESKNENRSRNMGSKGWRSY